jgi:hypothetical protein
MNKVGTKRQNEHVWKNEKKTSVKEGKENVQEGKET